MNGNRRVPYVVILFFLSSIEACSLPVGTARIDTPVPVAATQAAPVNTSTMVAPTSALAPATSVAGQNLSNVISLTYDASSYRSAKGGPLKNGCEGFLTLLRTGENLFASRCDASRLEQLGLYADAAMGFNQKEAAARRIAAVSGNYIMIDFEDEKSQALYGAVANNSEVYIILNDKKEYIYYRAKGSRSQLQELGFLADALFAANNSVDTDLRIQTSGDEINAAENKLDATQLLVGKTSGGAIVALVVDAHGNYVGYRKQP